MDLEVLESSGRVGRGLEGFLQASPSLSKPLPLHIPKMKHCVFKPFQVSPSLSKPLQASPSLSKPLQASTSLSKLLQASTSLSKPLQTFPSLSKPLQASPNLSKPLQVSPSLSEPLRASPSLSKPLPFHIPKMKHCQSCAHVTIFELEVALSFRVHSHGDLWYYLCQ